MSYKTFPSRRLDNSDFGSPSQLGQERNSINDDALSDVDSVILNGRDFCDCENQVRFVMDLIHQRVDQSQVMGHDSHLVSDALNESAFGVIEMNSSVRNVEFDFGLGTQENFGFQDVCLNDENSNIGYRFNSLIEDIIDDDDDDDFFVERRRVSGLESCDAGSSYSAHRNAVRVAEFLSDSESDENENSLATALRSRVVYGLDDVNVRSGHYDYGNGEDTNDDDDASITFPLCWNSLRLEDQRDQNEDFEWEEIDGRVDEREVLSMFLEDENEDDDNDDEASVSFSLSPIIAPEDMVSVERVGASGNLEWEVLLDTATFGSFPEQEQERNLDRYIGGHDDYIYTAEYETVFGQFAEMDTVVSGQPPAARLVVKRLPSIVLAKEDLETDNNTTCAVCKDDMNVGEKAKLLPCTHRYHEECIIPWLNIRNTCPVCRHELPTDDADYERRKTAERAAAGHHLVL
ncbi:E3 ubiquitin-protein ligase RING1 [Linum perenne]